MDERSHTEPPSAPALRIKALESLLTEKGLVAPGAVDEIIAIFEKRIGRATERSVVAHARADPCLQKATLSKMVARRSLNLASRARARTWWCWRIRRRCITLLCAPSAPVTLADHGLLPNWYKAALLSRAGRLEPRKVLAEFGIDAQTTSVRVWDSNAESATWCCRYARRAQRIGARRSSPISSRAMR